MSSELSDAVEGVTKGTLSYGESKIKSLVKRLHKGKLAFIQDDKTIDLVKDQLKTGEWSLCSQYITDKDIKLLVQMGMTLRSLDSNKNENALQNLRKKILHKYKKRGLHIAQFVQSKVLKDFIGSVADNTHSVGELIEKVEGLLSHLEKSVMFIQKKHNVEKKIQAIHTRLIANVPDTFIIFSSKSAIKISESIKNNLEKTLTDYEIKTVEEKNRLLIFLFRKENDLFEDPE